MQFSIAIIGGTNEMCDNVRSCIKTKKSTMPAIIFMIQNILPINLIFKAQGQYTFISFFSISILSDSPKNVLIISFSSFFICSFDFI